MANSLPKIIISGAAGAMGAFVAEAATGKAEIVCGVDINKKDTPFPLFKSFSEVSLPCDVVIDFSSVKCLDGILDYCKKYGAGAVLCTTGYTDEQKKQIAEAAKQIPIFMSANMSLGVNLLTALVKKAAAALPNFDVEIIEMHHNRKLDAPSGTALLLADAARKVRPELENVYDRHDRHSKRGKNEIGISSVRGGAIVGKHDVMFISDNEVVTLSHEASSREVFASGAVAAASFLSGKEPRLYSMDDMLTL